MLASVPRELIAKLGLRGELAIRSLRDDPLELVEAVWLERILGRARLTGAD